MILNETPIRTSKNYGINHITIDDFHLPKTIEKFNGLTITGDFNNVFIQEEKIEGNLTYGNGKELSEQIKNHANVNLHLTIDGEDEKQIELEFHLSERNKNLVEDILIEAKEKARGTIILKYLSDEKGKYYHNGQIRVTSQEQSNLKIIWLNLFNNQTENYVSIENTLAENATTKYTIVDFGGKNSITNYYTNLKGENAMSDISTIYLGTENSLLDLNYIAEVYGKNAKINMNLKGAIKDKATKHFKGTIDFKRGCQKAKGDENEYCTILSDTAKSISLPMLLCTEEDIEGNHGTASGKVDEKQLFYLMTRGFNVKEAQRLIVRGQFNEIIETIQDEAIKNIVVEQIEKKL